MDSRIREIEQWLAEAKAELRSCGQEAYIRKLYLLDAEIRSVIKDSGMLPEAKSPRHREKRVRRFYVPALATASFAGILILAAATVHLTFPIFGSDRNAPREDTRLAGAGTGSTGETVIAAAPPAGEPSKVSWREAGYVPTYLEGEEIIMAGFHPVKTVDGDSPAVKDQPSWVEAPVLLASTAPAIFNEQSTGDTDVPADTRVEDDVLPQGNPGLGATDVVIVAMAGSPVSRAAEVPVREPAKKISNMPTSTPSYGGGGMRTTIASARFDYFPEEEEINETKKAISALFDEQATVVDVVDNSSTVSKGSVDNTDGDDEPEDGKKRINP